MACDVDQLVTNATCVQCLVEPGMQLPVLLAIMCAIRDGDTGISCESGALITDARCIECKMPAGMLLPAIISVACQIAQAEG